MVKRILLALTFVAAFTAASVATPDSAEAWRRWGGRPYVTRYYAPPRVYYGAPYRSYYRGYYGPRYYAPRSYYYGNYYGDPGYNYYNYYGPRSGVSVSVGF